MVVLKKQTKKQNTSPSAARSISSTTHKVRKVGPLHAKQKREACALCAQATADGYDRDLRMHAHGSSSAAFGVFVSMY